MPSRPEDAARLLGSLRIVVFGLWAVVIARVRLADLTALPLELLDPPLLLGWVPLDWWPWILRPQSLTVLQVSLTVLLGLAACGVRPYRPVALVAAALLTIQQGLIRSYGFSSHAELVPLLATWVLAAWPAGDRLTLWPPRSSLASAEGYAAAITLIATLFCWTYAATGIHRIAYHGLDMFIGNSMMFYVVENSFRYGSGAMGIQLLEHPALATFVQLSAVPATLMEIAAPLALIHRRFRHAWVLFVVAFHLSSAVLLGTFFWQSMIVGVAALVALDWLRG